jgi:hypothetical protein
LNPPSLHFGLSDVTLEIEIPDNGGDEDDDNDSDNEDDEDDEGDDEDNDSQDGACNCEKNAGVCLCDVAAGDCGCSHGDLSQLKILSDNVHYLALGKPFIIDLEAEGGATPYAWSLKDDILPQGLTFSEEGIIEGTPEISGSFRVLIDVSDSEEKSASKRFTFLVVEDENLTVMTDALPDAQVGMFYAARVRASGGTKPYTWTLENLPAWLSFDPNSGILSGTPTEAAIYDLTAQVQDAEESTDSQLLRLSVYPHDGLAMTTRILPVAIQGKDYSAQLEVSGGIPPYVLTLRRGSSLPPGLELNSGTLAGIPSQEESYSFVIDAIDGNNLQGSAAYTMVILNAEALVPGHNDFTVKEYEDEKRILLNFSLPKDFDGTEVVNVKALTSPDSFIADSSSEITKESDGYRIKLTLQVAEYALNNKNWSALLDQLTLDGIVVKFQDASGEEMRFEEPLSVKEMKKEEEPKDDQNGRGSGGGGCSAGLGTSLLSLALIAILKMRKQG